MASITSVDDWRRGHSLDLGLVTWLRADTGPGRWEDDVFNGLDFRLVHLLLAEAELAEAPERAQMIRSDPEVYRQKTERVLGVSNTGQPAAAELDLGGADESTSPTATRPTTRGGAGEPHDAHPFPPGRRRRGHPMAGWHRPAPDDPGARWHR